MKKIIHTIGFVEDNDDIVIMGVIINYEDAVEYQKE